MKIRGVFFDMGGTIETFNWTPEFRRAATPDLHSMLLQAGIDPGIDTQLLYEMVSSGLERCHARCIETRIELPPGQVWREYLLPDCNVDPDKLAAFAEELMFFIETRFYQRFLRPEVPTVLKEISQMGYRIGLISNVVSRRQVPANLEEYGISNYFSPVVLSSEYGRRKPDPAIFHYAARLAMLPTSACIYIGDRIARDILGAKEAGYRMAVQILHDFDHGEIDDGPDPDLVIHSMTEVIDILRLDKSDKSVFTLQDSIRPCAVLFDAGDILYHRPHKGEKLEKFLSAHGRHLTDLDTVRRNEYSQQAYTGLITQDEYREATLNCYGINDPGLIEVGKQILRDEENEVEIIEGVCETLKILKKSGYLLGIITDTAAPVSDKLKWFKAGGFGNVWDSIISSSELGIRKPHPGIFQAALNQLGISAKDAIFVGHRVAELEGACAAGMTTVAFNYEPDARADYYIEHFSDLLSVPVVHLCRHQEES